MAKLQPILHDEHITFSIAQIPRAAVIAGKMAITSETRPFNHMAAVVWFHKVGLVRAVGKTSLLHSDWPDLNSA